MGLCPLKEILGGFEYGGISPPNLWDSKDSFHFGVTWRDLSRETGANSTADRGRGVFHGGWTDGEGR